ncbi:MAG TPA: sigma-70 family RNA polymerase sigma factor [Myxococcales bacterium]|nr:sigma-70 family RNA polymerase sigma factor [Myxococcales bacterium]
MSVVGLRVVTGGRAGEVAGPGPLAPAGLLAELYETHAAAVYGRCRYLLKDDAEAKDALQDVFVKVLHALPGFRAAASPSTWILRIATHHCLNLLRSRKALWREQLRMVQAERRQETESPDRRELVRLLLAAAPEEAQEVAVLYFVDELTQAEIAQELGRSLPTVRKRLREFLACAREALGVTLEGGDL